MWQSVFLWLQVLYLVEPVDEYCIQALPEYEGKKFQNVAKEGLKLDHSEAAKERKDALESEYKTMLDWLKDNALSGKVCEDWTFKRFVFIDQEGQWW